MSTGLLWKKGEQEKKIQSTLAYPNASSGSFAENLGNFGYWSVGRDKVTATICRWMMNVFVGGCICVFAGRCVRAKGWLAKVE